MLRRAGGFGERRAAVCDQRRWNAQQDLPALCFFAGGDDRIEPGQAFDRRFDRGCTVDGNAGHGGFAERHARRACGRVAQRVFGGRGVGDGDHRTGCAGRGHPQSVKTLDRERVRGAAAAADDEIARAVRQGVEGVLHLLRRGTRSDRHSTRGTVGQLQDAGRGTGHDQAGVRVAILVAERKVGARDLGRNALDDDGPRRAIVADLEGEIGASGLQRVGNLGGFRVLARCKRGEPGAAGEIDRAGRSVDRLVQRILAVAG